MGLGFSDGPQSEAAELAVRTKDLCCAGSHLLTTVRACVHVCVCACVRAAPHRRLLPQHPFVSAFLDIAPQIGRQAPQMSGIGAHTRGRRSLDAWAACGHP